jgi:hypothetical protein
MPLPFESCKYRIEEGSENDKLENILSSDEEEKDNDAQKTN